MCPCPADRFVADFIMESPMGKAGLSLQGLIASLKDHFAPGGVPPPERVRLLEILGSGQLQGQALQYKPSEGKGINLSGILADSSHLYSAISYSQTRSHIVEAEAN